MSIESGYQSLNSLTRMRCISLRIEAFSIVCLSDLNCVAARFVARPVASRTINATRAFFIVSPLLRSEVPSLNPSDLFLCRLIDSGSCGRKTPEDLFAAIGRAIEARKISLCEIKRAASCSPAAQRRTCDAMRILDYPHYFRSSIFLTDMKSPASRR